MRDMLASMPWRGPDARGIWENDRVTLGHLRLSILDLSDAANQPFADEFGRVLVFNGEIYNYLELRAELEDQYRFRTKSDTEVILAAYHVWGSECVTRFNGDWAFAIYDPTSRGLFLSRDRFGIKPLYVCRDGQRILFASEVRALLAGGVPPRMPRERLAEFLLYHRHENLRNTLIENVHPLRPSSSLFISEDGEMRESVYYSPENLFSASVPSKFDDAVEPFGEVLCDSIRVRFRSDVPVGVSLSGGLDSGTIVSVAAKDHQLATYSAVFTGSEADEGPLAKNVSQMYDTRHVEIPISMEDFFAAFPEHILAQDSPHSSERTTARYLVCKRASQDVTVLLDGQGGDEMLGGYEGIYKIFRKQYAPQLGVALKMHTKPRLPGSSLHGRLAELHPAMQMEDVRLSRYGERLPASCSGGDAYRERQYSILRNKLVPLLHTEDRLSMIHSIEGRVPLLDHRLIEFCFSLPVPYKMREYDKYILRTWVHRRRLLPESIIFRAQKRGFPTPFEDTLRTDPRAVHWFTTQLHDLLDAVPGIFNNRVVFDLIDEQQRSSVSNIRRLLGVMSVLMYIRQNRLTVS